MSRAARTRRAAIPRSPTTPVLWANFVIVSWRPASAANLAFFKWFGVDQPAFCSPLQRLCAEIGQREIARRGDTRSSLRVVVDRTRETCNHRNLPAPWIPTKSSKPLRPALRKRPFDLRTADCRPKGQSVMESQISKIYAPSNAAGCQLPINGFAHKTANGQRPLAAATGIARSARGRRHADGWPTAKPSCCQCRTFTSCTRCRANCVTSPTRTSA
jgi:hypothetical protein